MMKLATLWLGVGVCVLLGCGERPAASSPLGDRDWALIALGDKADPVGNGGKPVTLRFDTADSRVHGFGGCNRFTGSYELTGDKLTFGPLASTKMACEQGEDVENAFLPALGTVQSWKLADSVLVLEAAGVPVLRFRAIAD